MSEDYFIKVLDHGFVELIDWMGSDLTVANAARCSYGKKHDELSKADAELIKSIGSKGHVSPFKHPKIQLMVKVPIFVYRQLVTHRIGIDWQNDEMDLSEKSLRYTDASNIDIHIPESCRASGARSEMYMTGCRVALDNYASLLESGVKREDARCVLPINIYTEVMMTSSLLAIAHLINLREDSHAQWETQQYAKAIRELVRPLFPVSLPALLKEKP